MAEVDDWAEEAPTVDDWQEEAPAADDWQEETPAPPTQAEIDSLWNRASQVGLGASGRDEVFEMTPDLKWAQVGAEIDAKIVPKTTKRRNPDVNPMLLVSDSGLKSLMEQMTKVGPRLTGKRGAESRELSLVLSKYQGWAKELRPQMHFHTFVTKCEKWSGNNVVQNHLGQLRGLDSGSKLDDFIAQHEREMYAEQHAGENAPSAPVVSQAVLTQDQKDKAAEARLKALAIRQAKQAERQKLQEQQTENHEDQFHNEMFAMMAEEEHKSDLMASEEEMAMAAQMEMLDEPPARARGGIGESPLKRQRLQLDEVPAQTKENAPEEELATQTKENAPEEELATQTEEAQTTQSEEELATQMEEQVPAIQVEEAPATQPEEELATQEAATADASTEQTAESRLLALRARQAQKARDEAAQVAAAGDDL